MEAERLKGEVLCLTVEDGDDATMQSRRLGFCGPGLSRLSHITPPCDLCLMKDAKFDVCLGHSMQRRIESSVTDIADILQLKADRTYHLTPAPSPSP